MTTTEHDYIAAMQRNLKFDATKEKLQEDFDNAIETEDLDALGFFLEKEDNILGKVSRLFSTTGENLWPHVRRMCLETEFREQIKSQLFLSGSK